MGQVSLLPIKGGPQTQSKLIIIYYSLSKWRFYFPLDDQIGSPPPPTHNHVDYHYMWNDLQSLRTLLHTLFKHTLIDVRS